MMKFRMHHIGYLVSDIEKSKDYFSSLGYHDHNVIVYDKEREADIVFVYGQGTPIELISPREESDLRPLLKQYKNMPYHVCYEVDDIDQAVVELKTKGFLLFKNKAKARAIGNNAEVVFVIGSCIGIVELVQFT